MDIHRFHKRLVESIKLLSLPYDDQEKYFEDFTDKPFEVVDTFHSVFLLLPQILEAELIPYAAIPNILRLHIFIWMAGSDLELCDLEVEQFRSHHRWNLLREIAGETLQIMGEPLEKPDPDYI